MTSAGLRTRASFLTLKQDRNFRDGLSEGQLYTAGSPPQMNCLVGCFRNLILFFLFKILFLLPFLHIL